MNKQEKYINYIVDDLVKKTEIDYKRKGTSPFLPPFTLFSLSLNNIPSAPGYFSNHIKEMYGVRDEEMEIIWDQYVERIKPFIRIY